MRLTTLELETAATSTETAVLRVLTNTACVGGFLFGYDTASISGALPYLRDSPLLAHVKGDPARLAFTQEIIVVAAIIGAGLGSIIGGVLSDKIGRNKALCVADVWFVLGSALMALAFSSAQLIVGRVFVGLGIGLASVTVPVFLAECSIAEVRARLVTLNVLAITSGQFIAYLTNFFLSFLPGTWRWMLGIAALPAIVQLISLWKLPESPRWLQNKGQKEQAIEAASALGCLEELYSSVENDEETEGLTTLHHHTIQKEEEAAQTTAVTATVHQLLSIPKQLHLGIGVQILQQLCGINTVMYFLPVILQLAGVRSNRTALLISLVPAGVNALGTVIGMRAIETHGRRKLLLSSLIVVAGSLVLLSFAFGLADAQSPLILHQSMCQGTVVERCSDCLRAGCGYCASDAITAATDGGGMCFSLSEQGSCVATDWYVAGCPSKTLNVAFILSCILLYLILFAPGLGAVPWCVVSEIFPVEVRATAAGIAGCSNWIANAVVAQTFLTLMYLLGGGGTFLVYAAVAIVGFVWVYVFLPETKGLTLDQVEQLF